MTETPSVQPSPPTRAWKPLTPRQRRVLGVLIEKAKTTPATYPLTLNAVVLGCNQKNNREPVTSLDASEVEEVLAELRGLGVVTEIEGSGRVTKYRHEGYQWLGVDRAEMAVMGELLLRGEQTLGDLRARASRMQDIGDLGALKAMVDALVRRELMIEVTGPGRGQVVSHNLYPEAERAELLGRHAGDGAPRRSESPGDGRAFAERAPSTDRLAELSGEVAALRDEVDRLRARVEELESRLAAAGG